MSESVARDTLVLGDTAPGVLDLAIRSPFSSATVSTGCVGKQYSLHMSMSIVQMCNFSLGMPPIFDTLGHNLSEMG